MKKTPNLFKRNPENMRELLQEHNPVCEWVFSGEGVATRKYDGTCCLIEGGAMFKRREVKKGKNAPIDFVPVDSDPITGKVVGWVPVNHTSKEDDRHSEAFKEGLTDGTYELLGPKINKNPENMKEHILLKHSDAEKYLDAPRTFIGLSKWLEDKDIEGIVFHHKDGRMAKIRKCDFGQRR